MTKPTAKDLSDAAGIVGKLSIAAIPVLLGIIGWASNKWLERMETKQDQIFEKVSTMHGDHRELKVKVERNERDIERVQEHLKRTHANSYEEQP